MDPEIGRRVLQHPARYQQLDVRTGCHIKGALCLQPPQDPNLLRTKTAKIRLSQLFDRSDHVQKLNFLGPFDVSCLSRIPSQCNKIPQHSTRRIADGLDLVLSE